MTLPVPTEADEAKRLVAYLRVHGYLFTHIPNETGRSMEARRRAIRMKQQGVSRGFPDYLVVVGNWLVFVELKRRAGSRTTPEQMRWLAVLDLIPGVTAVVAHGAQEAIKVVEAANAGPRPPIEF